MAQRGATIGCWIGFDAYTAIMRSAFGDRWMTLRLDGLAATYTISFRMRFDSVTSAGSTIIDYTWFLDILADTGSGETVLVSLPSPWRAFVGRNENTIIYSQFPGHRIALRIGLSSEPSDGVYQSDGFVTAYVDDAPVASLTGLSLRGKSRQVVQTGTAVFWVHELLDRPWIELGPSAPSTTTDGALVSTPSDLLIWDDFVGGSLANWPPTFEAPVSPYVVASIGAAGTYGLSYTANATPSGSWIGSGPFVYRNIARAFTIPAETIPPPPPPPPGPPACPAPVFAGPSSGGVGCPAPVLP